MRATSTPETVKAAFDGGAAYLARLISGRTYTSLREIGKQIALRLAAQGADVVIAAAPIGFDGLPPGTTGGNFA